jgi:hypothetical protein
VIRSSLIVICNFLKYSPRERSTILGLKIYCEISHGIYLEVLYLWTCVLFSLKKQIFLTVCRNKDVSKRDPALHIYTVFLTSIRHQYGVMYGVSACPSSGVFLCLILHW